MKSLEDEKTSMVDNFQRDYPEIYASVMLTQIFEPRPIQLNVSVADDGTGCAHG